MRLVNSLLSNLNIFLELSHEVIKIQKLKQNSGRIKKVESLDLIKNLEKIPEIDACEYVFIDDLRIPNIRTPFLQNKILITQNSLKDFLMFDSSDIMANGKINNMTRLNYQQRVDLVILNNFENNYSELERLIDNDTIIMKNLGQNVLYMEDFRNNMYMIITRNERIIIEGKGATTQMKYIEYFNT